MKSRCFTIINNARDQETNRINHYYLYQSDAVFEIGK